MSLLGKILTFLNVLGAIGLLTLASMDDAKRQAWAYSVFRHDLLLNGLPVDRTEGDPEAQPVAEKIGEQTQQELFAAAGGQPVTTQEEEVERVQKDLQVKVPAAGDVAQQAAFLARLLVPFARSNSEREQLLDHVLLQQHFAQAYRSATQANAAGQPARAFDATAFSEALSALRPNSTGPLGPEFLKVLRADPQKSFDVAFAAAVAGQQQALDTQRAELQTQLDQLFREGLQGQRTVGGEVKPIAATERRRTIARLLFNLTANTLPEPGAGQEAQAPADATAYKRFLTVVGLRTAAAELDDQAQTLTQIASELGVERSREQGRFAEIHQKLLDRVQQRAVEVEEENARLAREQKQRNDQKALVEKRRDEVKQYTEELAEARKGTEARFQELRGMTQALLDLRIRVRDALNKSQEDEQRIRHLEEGR